MPKVTNVNLTVTTVGTQTIINVVYKAHFTPFERFLASKGMMFIEKISVQGVDAIASTILTSFADVTLAVTDGTSTLTLERQRSKTISRAFLQEDAAPATVDEIRCKITIEPNGFPKIVEHLTEQEALLG